MLKKKQKGTGTLAAVSRTPQRFKVSVKLRCVAPATLFGVCNDLPRRARNAFFRKFFAYFFTKNKVGNLQCISRKTNLNIIINLSSKVFCLLFLQTGRLLRRSSRKTNFVLIFTIAKKFFAYFFTKK